MTLAGTRLSGTMALFAVFGGVAVAAAQAKLPQDATWTLEGARGGYCIWYLADPALARKMVPGSAALTPAGTGVGLPTLLASTIKEEPRFAEWIPGSICVGFYQRVSSGDHTLAEARGTRPVIIATNALAAQNAHGVDGATDYLIDFLTDSRTLASAADRIGVDMGAIEYLARIRVEGGDPSITLTVAGTLISWSGHAIADSSVGKTRSVSFGYGGPKSANWLVRSEATPASSRLIVGNLSIEGRNNFAKALLASPVRAIGPLVSGGSATLAFHAVTKK